MISVKQARRILFKNTRSLSPVLKSLPQALGLVLAQDIHSPSDYPLYDVSAMDGYAFKTRDIRKASPSNPVFLKVLGTQHAGDFRKDRLNPGECLRVMTGGVIPSGADSVLERELVTEKNGMAKIEHPINPGRHVRYCGEGIRRKSIALQWGTPLHSRSIGFLASLGVKTVWVYPAPKVALIVTGNELIEPGQKPKPGEIYNSNQWMLEAALREIGLEAKLSAVVPDVPRRLKTLAQKALSTCDLVLLIGGVSVGDSDFSKPILESLGVKRFFWQVKQKPGFPLYFGKKGQTLVLGLPGNPASAWINFHEYVAPALRVLQGFSPRFFPTQAILDSEDIQRGWKTLFLKGRLYPKNGKLLVRILDGQASHLLKSLAKGDSLVVIPPGKGKLKKGSRVEVHPLPGEKK